MLEKELPVFSIYTDGKAEPNPGKCYAAYCIYSPNGKILRKHATPIKDGTNNEAELGAILQGMLYARENGFKHIEVHSDSQLSIKWIRGEFRMKKPHIQEIVHLIRRLASCFETAAFIWTTAKDPKIDICHELCETLYSDDVLAKSLHTMR